MEPVTSVPTTVANNGRIALQHEGTEQLRVGTIGVYRFDSRERCLMSKAFAKRDPSDPALRRVLAEIGQHTDQRRVEIDSARLRQSRIRGAVNTTFVNDARSNQVSLRIARDSGTDCARPAERTRRDCRFDHSVILARDRVDHPVREAVSGFLHTRLCPLYRRPMGNLQRMFLPVVALSLPMLANLSRLVRSAMLDALGQDYIRTARAKGAAQRRVLYVHALRNALIPFITSVGVSIGYLLGGSIVIEQVFAIPGLGRLVLGAISERNYPLVQASILVLTTAFVLVNFAVDLWYAIIDPRVSRS